MSTEMRLCLSKLVARKVRASVSGLCRAESYRLGRVGLRLGLHVWLLSVPSSVLVRFHDVSICPSQILLGHGDGQKKGKYDYPLMNVIILWKICKYSFFSTEDWACSRPSWLHLRQQAVKCFLLRVPITLFCVNSFVIRAIIYQQKQGRLDLKIFLQFRWGMLLKLK